MKETSESRYSTVLYSESIDYLQLNIVPNSESKNRYSAIATLVALLLRMH